MGKNDTPFPVTYTDEYCINLLRLRQDELNARGEPRFPQRSDFTEREVVAIKARLGPWPRALEKAGIKPSDGGERAQARLEKRIRAKRQRTEAKISERSNLKHNEKAQDIPDPPDQLS